MQDRFGNTAYLEVQRDISVGAKDKGILDELFLTASPPP